MPAVLAGTDRLIGDIPDGIADLRGCSLVLLFLKRGREQAQDQPGDEQEDPGEQVDDPPPPTDQQLPKAAMAFLLVF